MNPTFNDTARHGLRGWWASPPRTGFRRAIAPYEYRHLRGFGVTRMAGGGFLLAAGVLLLSYGSYGWMTLFLVLGALNLGGGYWYITIDRSEAARTGTAV